jgi:predicted phosphohydrolase
MNNNTIEIQYVSDLHHNYINITPKCKYLALLGDLGDPYSKSYECFLRENCSKFEKVFLITGNHEYYENILDDTNIFLKSLCNSIPNCIFLNNESMLIEGFLIIGSTLWSNVRDSIVNDLNAFHYIYETPEKILTPTTYRNMHKLSVDFIESELDKNIPSIILTHYAPHIDMNGPDKYSKYSSAFSTYLTHLNNKHKNIKCWLSGHTHKNLTIVRDGVICSSNCLGNLNEGVLNFDSSKTIINKSH